MDSMNEKAFYDICPVSDIFLLNDNNMLPLMKAVCALAQYAIMHMRYSVRPYRASSDFTLISYNLHYRITQGNTIPPLFPSKDHKSSGKMEGYF